MTVGILAKSDFRIRARSRKLRSGVRSRSNKSIPARQSKLVKVGPWTVEGARRRGLLALNLDVRMAPTLLQEHPSSVQHVTPPLPVNAYFSSPLPMAQSHLRAGTSLNGRACRASQVKRSTTLHTSAKQTSSSTQMRESFHERFRRAVAAAVGYCDGHEIFMTSLGLGDG